MKDEKAEFAARLRAALRDAHIEASAAVIEKRFNSRYSGAPVTAQAISGWLNGKAIPRQDKLRVLAAIVGMDPHVLQYGDESGRKVRDKSPPWKIAAVDQLAIDAFLALPGHQRKLIRELIDQLAAAGPAKRLGKV